MEPLSQLSPADCVFDLQYPELILLIHRGVLVPGNPSSKDGDRECVRIKKVAMREESNMFRSFCIILFYLLVSRSFLGLISLRPDSHRSTQAQRRRVSEETIQMMLQNEAESRISSDLVEHGYATDHMGSWQLRDGRTIHSTGSGGCRSIIRPSIPHRRHTRLTPIRILFCHPVPEGTGIGGRGEVPSPRQYSFTPIKTAQRNLRAHCSLYRSQKSGPKSNCQPDNTESPIRFARAR